MEVAYSRVMFLGTAGVGKTCFNRALRRLPWEDYIASSTVISDVTCILPPKPVPIYSVSNDDTTNSLAKVRSFSHQRHTHKRDQWIEVTHEEEIEELAQLLVAVHHQMPDMNRFSKRLKMHDSFSEDSEVLDETNQVEKIISEAITVTTRYSKTYQPADLHSQSFFNFWDFGGQPAFLEILPAFLTPRTMFFLLFDASKPLNSNWQSNYHIEGKRYEGEEVNMTTCDYMLNWMANIHSHLMAYNKEGGVADYPRMFCIGTHGDMLTEEGKIKVIKELKDNYRDKDYNNLIEDTLIIDNTSSGLENEDPSLLKVRKELIKFANEKLIKLTPLTWVLFRKVLQVLGQNVISIDTAYNIGVASNIPRDDVPSVLLFYHDLGTVLFYPQLSGLKDKVIVNPKYFVDSLGMIFSFMLDKEVPSRLTKEVNLFQQNGILVQTLYAEVWKSCKDLKPHMFIEVLVHFRLAAPVTTDLYPPPSLQYFVPAVLQLCGDVSITPPPHSFHASPLHITFSTGFVTPGFFTRFVTTLVCHSQIQLYLKDRVFRNRVTFRYQDTNSSSFEHSIVTDTHDAIQIDVFCAIEGPSPVPLPIICQNLLTIFEDSAQEVDNVLESSRGCSFEKMVTYPVTRKLKYVCTNCPQTTPLHYLKLGPGHTKSTFPVLCDKVTEYRPLTDKEKTWFYDPLKAIPTSRHETYTLPFEGVMGITPAQPVKPDSLLETLISKQAGAIQVDPVKLFEEHLPELCNAIEGDVLRVSDYCVSLIPTGVRNDILTTLGVSEYAKASKLVNEIHSQLRAKSGNKSDQCLYLLKVCEALLKLNKTKLNVIIENMISKLN